MYCSNCGTQLDESCKFCPDCGAQVQKQEPFVQEIPTMPEACAAPAAEPRQISFQDAISLYFRKYVVFSGRATRREYWYVILFNLIVTAVLNLVSMAKPDLGGLLSGVYALVTLLPGWALFTRRMHDIDKSGWNWLWILLPLVGPIVLLCRLCRASGEDNKYGPKPF